MKEFIEAFFITLLSVIALLLVFANTVKNANDKTVSRLFEDFGIALTVPGIVIVVSMNYSTLDLSVKMRETVKGTVLMTVGIHLINSL
jgi:hypothetical protein